MNLTELNKARIAKNIQEAYIQTENDFLEKGKEANFGEIREWGGHKYRKGSLGWTHIKDGDYNKELREREPKNYAEESTEKKAHLFVKKEFSHYTPEQHEEAAKHLEKIAELNQEDRLAYAEEQRNKGRRVPLDFIRGSWQKIQSSNHHAIAHRKEAESKRNK